MSNRTKKRFRGVAVRGVVETKLDGKFHYRAWHDSLTLGSHVPTVLNRKTTIHGEQVTGVTDSAALAKVQVELEIERLGAKICKAYEEHELACADDAARVRLANSLWPDDAARVRLVDSLWPDEVTS